MIGDIHKAILAIPIAALMIMQFIGNSAATTSQTPALDFSAEGRVLDAFVDDLVVFDKKGAELRKRASLTRAEFAAYERQGDDLKRRVSGVQNALRQVIDKLKAAGQWDNLDQIVLAETSDSRFQSFVRREGFKRTLETAAAGLSNSVNEITNPVADELRNKVQGRAPDSIFERSDSTLAARAVRVAYTPAPVMFAKSVRCALAQVRVKITRGKDGRPSDRANSAFNCYCLDFDCPTT